MVDAVTSEQASFKGKILGVMYSFYLGGNHCNLKARNTVFEAESSRRTEFYRLQLQRHSTRLAKVLKNQSIRFMILALLHFIDHNKLFPYLSHFFAAFTIENVHGYFLCLNPVNNCT